MKLRALGRLAALAGAFALLAILSVVFPDQALSLVQLWRPRTSTPVALTIGLGGAAFLMVVTGAWMALLTPHQELQMLRKREAKGKPIGSPHPSLFDENDPDHHLSTVDYLRKKRRA